jgi:phage baseplate assembly protein W
MAENRTLSIQFPFQDNEIDGKLYKMNTTSIDDVRSSLYFFLTTKKGDRWYNPNFGSRLHEFLFEKNDEIVASELTQIIKDDIEVFFKNIIVDNIEINQTEKTNNLEIILTFSFSNLFANFQDELRLTF